MTSDDALFLAEMDGVAPLAESHLRVRAESPEAPSLAQLARRQAGEYREGQQYPHPWKCPSTPSMKSPSSETGCKPGCTENSAWAILEATLDLHRMTVREAREAVWRCA